MSETPANSARVGWETLWQSGVYPPRYQKSAPPNETVVTWAATLPNGAFVLDVGCGLGRHLHYLGTQGFRLAGVDISPTSIQISREVCAEHHFPFEGQVSDMTYLPWADATFDAAFSIATIHHHRRAGIQQALAEIRRVLKVGGLVLVDLLATARADYAALRAQVAAGEIIEVEPNTFVDERPDSPDLDGFLPHHYCDEAAVRDLLRDFEILKLELATRPAPDPAAAPTIDKWVAWLRKV
jgi:SAM-dependent methyltransferase